MISKLLPLSLWTILLSNFALSSWAQGDTKTYTIDEPVYSLQVDSAHNHLLLMTGTLKKNGKDFKEKGHLQYYDIATQKALWSQTFYPKGQKAILYPQGVMANDQSGSAQMLHLADGTKAWEEYGSPVYFDAPHNAFLWYTSQSDLECIDATTGQSRWKTKNMESQYGWISTMPVNDSIFLIQSDGIKLLNMRNGHCLSYAAKVGQQSYKPAITTSIVVGLLDVFLGGSLFTDISPTRIAALCSNVLATDNNRYYMADRNGIFCLNDSLKRIWHTAFPKDAASSSLIYDIDDLIYMVNYGYAYMGEARPIGYPFIACYEKDNGKQLFFRRMAENKAPIRECFRKGNREYMLFSDKMKYFELSDTSKVHSTDWDEARYGKLKGLMTHDIYILQDDSVHYKRLSPDNQILVSNDHGIIYELDDEMKVTATHAARSCYSSVAEYKGAILLGGNDKLIRINDLGVKQEEVSNVLLPVAQSYNHVFAIKKSPRNKIVDITL
jgi:hypothetical protein